MSERKKLIFKSKEDKPHIKCTRSKMSRSKHAAVVALCKVSEPIRFNG